MDALVTDVHLRAVVAGIRGLGRGGRRIAALAPARGGRPVVAVPVGARGRTRCDPRRARIRARGARSDCEARPTAGPHGVRGWARRPGARRVPGPREVDRRALPRLAGTAPRGHLRLRGNHVLNRLRDKATLSRLAEEAGVRVPRRLAEGSAAELASADLEPPCVVKPTRSESTFRTARVVASGQELRDLLARLPADEPLLVQERAQGPLMSLAVVIGRDGELVARFQQVARRTWPVETGVSAMAVGVAPDEELTRRVTRMLAGAGFWGMAQLQFIGTGSEAVLIDFNPRFFGSLPLAIASGVNLPAAWHSVALGAPGGPPPDYRVGVTYRWLEADLTAVRHGRWTALRPAARPSVGAAWALDDPLPGLILGAGAVKARVRQRL